ncbi:MAG: YfjI family protein [Bryobacteraceae bacterium]
MILRNDPAAALRALKVFHEPDDIVEIRVLSGRKSIQLAGYFHVRNEPAILSALRGIRNDAGGVYFVLNKIDPTLIARAANKLKHLGHTTRDCDILERRWLFIDVDMHRPAGLSSTEEEHQAALDTATSIKAWLSCEGWPLPILADSGNGAHLHYRLPALDLTRGDELVRLCLKALAVRFGVGRVEIDERVKNLSRVCKLYGTVARKGDVESAERAHRLSYILELPDRVEPVPVELLEHLARQVSQPKANVPVRKANNAGEIDIEAWLQRSSLDVKRGPEAWNGGRRWVLNTCPFDPEHKDSAAILELNTGALAFNCFHNSCQTHDWRELRNLVESDSANHPGPIDEACCEPWQEPIPLTAAPPASLRTDDLPGVLGEFASALSRHTETPPDLSILSVLGALSAAVAGKIEVEAEPGYIEPAHIWVCTLLGSGSRKTAVLGHVRTPIDQFEDEERKRLQPEILRVESERKTKLAVIEKLRKKLPVDCEAELSAQRDRIGDLESEVPAELHSVTLLTSDTTPEALEALMEQNGGRMAIISDEGAIIDILEGRYSSQPNLDIFLRGHTASRVNTERRSRRAFISRACLTICLVVQPAVLKNLKPRSCLRGRGFWARFLYAVPESPIGQRKLNPAEIPSSLQLGYAALMAALLRWKQEQPILVRLAEDSHHIWKEFQRQVEELMAHGRPLETLCDWGSKLPGAALRIAGILHAANQASSLEALPNTIQQEEMSRAIAICSRLIPHAIATFDLVEEPSFMASAKHILSWLEKQKASTVSKRDCYRSLHRHFGQVSEMDKALRILTDHSYIRLVATPTGGRPSELIEINPHWSRKNW